MKRRPAFRAAPVGLRWLALVALILLAPILSGAIPSWWVSRGVVASGPPAPGESDFAALNLGQLKTLAFAAYAELAASGSAGASTGIEDLLKTWCQTNSSGNIQIGANGRPTAKPATSETADFAAVNVGQLKTVAKPFYERLIAIGYVDDFPWVGTSDPASDFAMANVGQAKTLFSFDVKPDSDSDGIPDWWELRHGLAPNFAGDALLTTIFWGVKNRDAYALGYSRTRTGQARLAPTRPNVPRPPDAYSSPNPPPPSASATGTIIGHQVLTAHRSKSLYLTTSSFHEIAMRNTSTYEWEYYKEVDQYWVSTDPPSLAPDRQINGDVDITGNPIEPDDPRDYGPDDLRDDGNDADGNGDPDEATDLFPLKMSVAISEAEWEAHRYEPGYSRIQDYGTEQNPTIEPESKASRSVRTFSADRGYPGSEIVTEEYTPLGGGSGSAELEAVGYGSDASHGWLGSGPLGVTGDSATANRTYHLTYDSWEDEDGVIHTYPNIREQVVLQWAQLRVQTNVAPPSGVKIETPFAIYEKVEIGTSATTSCLGVITLITDPGNLRPNRFRVTPSGDQTLTGMVRSSDGGLTLNIEPAAQAVDTKMTLTAVAAPTIVIGNGMAGVVGDEIPSILGINGEKHFVSPRKTTEIAGDNVLLNAIGVSAADFATYYRWDVGPVDSSSILGSPVPGFPMSYRAARGTAGICRVRIVTQRGGYLVDKFNVWVVWADCQIFPVAPATFHYLDPAPAYPEGAAEFSRPGGGSLWRFLFTIRPSQIIGAAPTDVPNLTGLSAAQFPVPGAGANHYYRNAPADSATRKWDVSRQMREVIVDDTITRTLIDFPGSNVAGNDDPPPENPLFPDEDDDPYQASADGNLAHAIGQLSSIDGPRTRKANDSARPRGSTYSDDTDFFEFARVQLWDGKRTDRNETYWFRISDFHRDEGAPSGSRNGSRWHHYFRARWDKPNLLSSPKWIDTTSNAGHP